MRHGQEGRLVFSVTHAWACGPTTAWLQMTKKHAESSACPAEPDVAGSLPHGQSGHSVPHRAPHTTRDKVARMRLGNRGMKRRSYSSPSSCRARRRSDRLSAHEFAEEFHRSVNRRIRMQSARAGANGAGRRQCHRHCAGNRVARPVALASSQDDSRASDVRCVLGKDREHLVLRIRSSLRVT